MNQLRTEINTAVGINPTAVFQQKIPSRAIGGVTLAPLPSVTLAPLPAMVAPQAVVVPSVQGPQVVPSVQGPQVVSQTVVSVPPQSGLTQLMIPMPVLPGTTGLGVGGLPSLPQIDITSPTQQTQPAIQITKPKTQPSGFQTIQQTQPIQVTTQQTQPSGFQPLTQFPQIMTSPGTKPVIQMQQGALQTTLSGTQTFGLPNVTTTALPTIALPTTRATKASQRIHLPKINTTVRTQRTVGTQKINTTVRTQRTPKINTVGTQGYPQIRLPTVQTVMQPIVLTSPVAITQQKGTGLAVAYTPQQQVVENIMRIDPTRLNPRRARKDDNSYSVKQLKAIAGSINLTKSGNKKELVDRIKSAILKVNPNAFNL